MSNIEKITRPLPDALTVTITRDQLECWAGRELSDDEVCALDEALPNSSIPDAINIIAENLSEEQT